MTPQIPIRRAFSGFPLLLLLWLLSFTSFARVSADSGSNTHTTCDPSIANDGNFTWWNNKKGDNPCQVLQNLLRECDSGHTIHLMPASPLTVPDICNASVIGNTDGENDFSPCCCNTAAYALRQACWSCQQGREDPRKPDRRPTFREYLQCPNTAPNSKKIFKSVHVPKWAFIPVDPDSTWGFTQAQTFTRLQNSKSMMSTNTPSINNGSSSNGGGGGGSSSDDDDDDDDDDDNDKGHGDNHNNGNKSSQASQASDTSSGGGGSSMDTKTMAIAIAGGVLAGLAAVACVLSICICIQRRRRRALQPVQPVWYARGEYMPSTVRASQTDIDLESPVAAPRPTLGRGRVVGTGTQSGASWSSSLAREPLIPRAGSTLEASEVMYASDPRMVSYGRPNAIMSTSKTHSFSI